MNKILEVINLSKDFYTLEGEINAIDNISFDVYENEFLSIVGSSGCGKSTLLNILAKLDLPTQGSIKFNIDKPIVGYMFQSDALLPWLTVLENAVLGLDIMNIKTKDNIKYTKDLLIKYGLEEFIDKRPDELSGGMKQRVALIRTLAIKPDILLLDEPFSALDYQNRLKVADDVYSIIKKEKKTAIMITHDIAEAVSLSSRVVVLSKRPGKIKKILEVQLDNEKTPLQNRQDKNFSKYYDIIWKEIDENG